MIKSLGRMKEADTSLVIRLCAYSYDIGDRDKRVLKKTCHHPPLRQSGIRSQAQRTQANSLPSARLSIIKTRSAAAAAGLRPGPRFLFCAAREDTSCGRS